MGRLTFGMNCSLDGYIHDADGNFAWSEPEPDLHEHFNRWQEDTALDIYGRRLWEAMRYWQDPPPEAMADPVSRGFAEAWQRTDAIVVSGSLTEADLAGYPRTRLWRTLDPDRLRDLVRDTDGRVTIGGPTLAAGALRAGLVDEVTAWVVPHVAGGGLRLLPDGFSTRLRLREERRWPGGVVELAYDVVRAGDGSAR